MQLHGAYFYPGDYNGDGKTDLIVKSVDGTYQLLGQYPGGFSSSGWQRQDLTISGNVNIIPGDYTGDKKCDIILAQGGHTDLYHGLAVGGFDASTWPRTDFDSYTASFFKGDFTGDGKDDLLVTVGTDRPGLTSEYKGQAPNGLSAPVWFGDMTLGQDLFF